MKYSHLIITFFTAFAVYSTRYFYLISQDQSAEKIQFSISDMPSKIELSVFELTCETSSPYSLPSTNLSLPAIDTLIQNIRVTNQLNQTLNNQLTVSEFAVNLAEFDAPYLVFTLIIFFIFIGMLLACTLCQRLCCLKSSYTLSEQQICIIPLFAITVVIVAGGFFTFVLNTRMKDNLSQTICYMNYAYNGLLYGTNDTQTVWMGIYTIPTILNLISGNVSLVQQNLGSIFDNVEWMVTTPESQAQQIDTTYTTFNNMKLISPNPNYTQQTIDAYIIEVKLFKFYYFI